MRKLTLLVLVGFSIAGSSHAAEVTVQYSATTATVVGTPFGVDPTLGTVVTGSFTYETTTVDINGDPDSGDYPHLAGGAFSATIQGYGVTLTGSTTPFVQVENFTPDTFRFIDGPRIVGNDGGVMSVNAAPDSTIQLWMAITDGSGTAFSDDSLPEVFPFTFPGPPNTFSLSDSAGTLLLQFSSASTAVETTTWGRIKALYSAQ